LLRHAFDVWQVHSVALRTDVRNQRSRRAILGIGAKFEGVRRAHTAGSDCTVRDSAYFSIIPDEWPAARALLEQKLA
jgi:RimJ/RimL family protein N-acetyltransferase